MSICQEHSASVKEIVLVNKFNTSSRLPFFAKQNSNNVNGDHVFEKKRGFHIHEAFFAVKYCRISSRSKESLHESNCAVNILNYVFVTFFLFLTEIDTDSGGGLLYDFVMNGFAF